MAVMISSRLQSPQRYILSLLVTAGLFSKLLHLYQHRSLPLYLIALYFPTFFIQEFFLFTAAWFILHKTTGWFSVAAVILSGFVACLDWIGAASQYSFWWKTGNEIRWDAARSVGASQSGLKLILSGLGPTVVFSVIILGVSWLVATPIQQFMSRWLGALLNLSRFTASEDVLPGAGSKTLSSNKSAFWTLCIASITLGLWIVRPAIPFNHMSDALPFAMAGSHGASASAGEIGGDDFPLPETLDEGYWELPQGHYRGWAPAQDFLSSPQIPDDLPSWASSSMPKGFERWAAWASANKTADDEGRFYYDPTRDPMRITNLDLDPVTLLTDALKDREIPINHIVFIFLESGRKDLFPLKKGSHLHEAILKSHDFEKSGDETALSEKLGRMTPISELLTGEQSGFNDSSLKNDILPSIRDPTKFGGINVDGVLSGSTLSAKSRLVNYCGIGPLPVDFMYENNVVPYQPCLMHIMNLFNTRKNESSSKSSDSLEQEWRTIYMQSVTGGFQDQTKLMKLLGFEDAVYSEDIDSSSSKYFHEGMEKVNYFGYPETEIKPYMRDAINETLSQNKRLFLSHFTSSTHHPWGTPADFKREEYFGHLGSHHQDMDHYMNAIRFVDTWVGEMMGLLEEAGIANQTLTVFVGDHAQAFREDTEVTGTYENPHISNFRVPMLFHHPLLPRIQLEANASSVSILPTILDLLITTKSLNDDDREIALDLLNEYEGQSFIRPYKSEHNGREAWDMGVINAGGTMLSVGSAAVPYRLNLPLSSEIEFRFTNLDSDPYELSPLTDWTVEAIASKVEAAHGPEAAEWLVKAEQVGSWWVKKQKKLWDYEDEDD